MRNQKVLAPPNTKSPVTIKRGTPYLPPKKSHKICFNPQDCLFLIEPDVNSINLRCSKTITDNGETIHHHINCQNNYGFCEDFIPKTISVYHLQGVYQENPEDLEQDYIKINLYNADKEEIINEYNYCHEHSAYANLKITKETLSYEEASIRCKNLQNYLRRNLDYYRNIDY